MVHQLLINKVYTYSQTQHFWSSKQASLGVLTWQWRIPILSDCNSCVGTIEFNFWAGPKVYKAEFSQRDIHPVELLLLIQLCLIHLIQIEYIRCTTGIYSNQGRPTASWDQCNFIYSFIHSIYALPILVISTTLGGFDWQVQFIHVCLL